MRRFSYFNQSSRVTVFDTKIWHRRLFFPDRQRRRKKVCLQCSLKEGTDHIPFLVVLRPSIRPDSWTNVQAHGTERSVEGRDVCDMNTDGHGSDYHQCAKVRTDVVFKTALSRTFCSV